MTSVPGSALGAAAPSASGATRFQYFAVTAPGLESLLARELEAFGLDARIVRGGVEGKVTHAELWKLHLRSSLAESVRIRLKSFGAHDFAMLEQGLKRLPWHAYLRPGDAFSVNVTCHKSKLFHSDAVAERVHAAIRRAWGRATLSKKDAPAAADTGAESQESPATGSVPQQIFVRLMRDEVTTSIDASGERLHRRGYRTHVEKAPLRETLAAAMVRLLAQLGGEPHTVCDPFCGSAVLPLEWLQWRAGHLPGAGRTFAFEQWPIHSPEAWQQLRSSELEIQAQALRDAPPSSHAVCGDLDAKALSSARSNADGAGQAGQMQFVQGDFRTTLLGLKTPSAVLTNPPYGVRIGNQKQALAMSLELDRVLAERPELRPAVMTCVDPAFQRRARLPWRKLAETQQGGLELSVLGLQ
jgi:putative N6-adenine-specific DNA methylase